MLIFTIYADDFTCFCPLLSVFKLAFFVSLTSRLVIKHLFCFLRTDLSRLISERPADGNYCNQIRRSMEKRKKMRKGLIRWSSNIRIKGRRVHEEGRIK